MDRTTAGTIFVADDDVALLRGLDRALSGRGYHVRTASNGASLLALMEVERPDLVLLDVMMPGMTGLELLGRIRRDGRWPDLPVMVVTAMPDAEVRAAAAEGSAEVVPKPFLLDELVRRIERWLRPAPGGVA